MERLDHNPGPILKTFPQMTQSGVVLFVRENVKTAGDIRQEGSNPRDVGIITPFGRDIVVSRYNRHRMILHSEDLGGCGWWWRRLEFVYSSRGPMNIGWVPNDRQQTKTGQSSQNYFPKKVNEKIKKIAGLNFSIWFMFFFNDSVEYCLFNLLLYIWRKKFGFFEEGNVPTDLAICHVVCSSIFPNWDCWT